MIARAARIADEAMSAIAKQARPGLSPRAAAAIAAACFLENGAHTGETGPIVPGVGDHEFLHGVMTAQPLGDGDILHDPEGSQLRRPSHAAGLDRRGQAPPVTGRRTARRLAGPTDRRDAAGCARLRRRRNLARGRALGRPASGLRQRHRLYAGDLWPDTTPQRLLRVFLPNARWRLEEGMVFHMYASAAGLGFSETVVVEAEAGRRLASSARELLIASAM